MTATGDRRRLVVNADDFGFTRGVNEGIVDAHRRGILTATTLMANGDAFEHAVELAGAHASLDVGCHLVLIGGRSLARAGRDLPASIPALVRALVRGRIPVHDEFEAQIRRILDAGVQPTHLDTHKHTHLLPPVLEAVARLSQRYGIRWVRRPIDIADMPVRFAAPFAARAASRAMRLMRPRFERIFARHGCRATDYFTGFLATGRFRTGDLAALIRALPPGTTEFMCHPGYPTPELERAPTRLKQSRARELEALVAPETRAALAEAGVELVSYRELEARG
jgi:chitin disaccharide deacetylase